MRAFLFHAIALALTGTAVAPAETAACGGLKLVFKNTEEDCFPLDPGAVHVRIHKDGATLLERQAPAPPDRYYSTIVEEEIHIGYFFHPGHCEWRAFVGSPAEVAKQIECEQSGAAYDYPSGISIEIVCAATGQMGGRRSDDLDQAAD